MIACAPRTGSPGCLPCAARILSRALPAVSAESIDAALDDLNRDRGDIAGTVKITATRQAYEAVIRPVLAEFGKRHPNASIEILIEYEFRDIIAGRLDAGISLGEKLEQDMIALKVSSDLSMAVVASPAYLAIHGAPDTPQDLRHHRCIGFRMRAGGAIIGWDFEHDGREIEVKIEGPLIVNEPELATDAALDGLGITYVLEDRAAPYLADGRLIRMMEEWTPPFPVFFLYYPSRRQMPPTLGAFIAILRERRSRQ